MGAADRRRQWRRTICRHRRHRIIETDYPIRRHINQTIRMNSIQFILKVVVSVSFVLLLVSVVLSDAAICRHRQEHLTGHVVQLDHHNKINKLIN